MDDWKNYIAKKMLLGPLGVNSRMTKNPFIED